MELSLQIKNKKISLMGLMLIGLISACGNPITKYEEPTRPYTIYFEPDLVETTFDSNTMPNPIDVKIMIKKVTDLCGLDATILLLSDSTAANNVKIANISEGTLLSETGENATLFLARSPVNSNYVNIQCVRLQNMGITQYEPGHLATLHLEPLSKGAVWLEWEECRLFDSTKPTAVIIDAIDHTEESALLIIN